MSKYTLDVTKRGRQFTIEGLHVGDNGFRTFVFCFIMGGAPFPLPEGCIATLFAYLPGGVTVYDLCTVLGDTVIYNLVGGVGSEASLTSVPGIAECEIRITSQSGEVLTSPKFSMLIDPVLQDDGAIEAQDSFTALTETLKRVVESEKGLASKVDRVYGAEGNVVVFGKDGTLMDGGAVPKPSVTSVNGKLGAVELTAEDVGADPAGKAAERIAAHNQNVLAHNDIRTLIAGLTTRLNALADSDDTTLDQLSEIVAYIKSNKTLIDSITTSKVSVSDIVDDLATKVTTKPLSAAQGAVLKELIDKIIVPSKLPNPNALTFTGAAAGSYDGSSPLEVNIPEGGSGGKVYTVPYYSPSTITDVQKEEIREIITAIASEKADYALFMKISTGIIPASYIADSRNKTVRATLHDENNRSYQVVLSNAGEVTVSQETIYVMDQDKIESATTKAPTGAAMATYVQDYVAQYGGGSGGEEWETLYDTGTEGVVVDLIKRFEQTLNKSQDSYKEYRMTLGFSKDTSDETTGNKTVNLYIDSIRASYYKFSIAENYVLNAFVHIMPCAPCIAAGAQTIVDRFCMVFSSEPAGHMVDRCILDRASTAPNGKLIIDILSPYSGTIWCCVQGKK